MCQMFSLQRIIYNAKCMRVPENLDIKSDPVTKHAMHFGVNLLIEIFRDTHTLCYQRQAVFLTVLTDVLREHLYVPNQTRIHRGRGIAYISLNTSRKRERGGGAGRNE